MSCCGNGPKCCDTLETRINNLCLVQFEPFNTIFLAESWPPCADPNVFFTNLAAVHAKAAALVASTGQIVDVLVAPGVYGGDISLSANGSINFKSLGGSGNQGSNDIIFTGAISWAALANAGIDFTGIDFTNANGITAVGPASSQLTLNFCSVPKISVSGGMIFESLTSSLGVVSVSGGSMFYVLSGSLYTSATVDGAGTDLIARTGTNCSTNVTLTNSSRFDALGGTVIEGTLTVGANCLADIRGSYVEHLAGTGKIQRSLDTMSITTTGGGATDVKTFAGNVPAINPYNTAPSAILFQNGTASGRNLPEITAVLGDGSGFSVTDFNAGAGTYTLVIFQK